MDNFKILTPGLKFLECKKKEKGRGWGGKERNEEDEIQSVKGVA